MSETKKRVIAILVDNEFGALARIVELFSARGYNIETLTVAPISLDKSLSRVTVTTFGTDNTIELICKLLKRIIPVHYAAELSETEGYIERELALVQIIGDEDTRQKALEIIREGYRSKILELSGNSMVFEIIGSSNSIDTALEKLAEHGLKTVSRTGIAAGFKGEKRLDEIDG